MSDPVSKSEIEDVLASIRRLVSVDDRAAQSAAAPAPSREEDKLILTPSQRVDESKSRAEDILEFVDQGVEPESDERDDTGDSKAGDTSGDSQSGDDDWDTPEEPFEAVEEDLDAEEAAFEAEEEAFEAEADGSDDEGDEEAGFSGHDPFEQEDPDGEVITHSFRTQGEPQQAGPDEEEEKADTAQAVAPEVDTTAEAVVEEPADDADDADASAKISFQHTPINELQARIAEVEAAVAARDDDWEPDGTTDDDMSASEVPSMEWQDEPDDTGYGAPKTEVEDAEVIEAEEDAEDDTEAAVKPEPAVEAEPVDEAEAAPEVEPEPEPEPAPVDEAEAEPEVEPEPEPEVEPVAEANVEPQIEPQIEPVSEAEAEPAVEPEPVDVSDVEPQPAKAPEPVAASAQEEVFEAEAETADELREAETAEAMQEETSAKAETEDDGAGLWASDDEGFLDEAALRDMVSEIVRQELQGALGERITRNVRKLVRREIHRALMSQGIE